MPDLPPFGDLVWPEGLPSPSVPSGSDLVKLDERLKALGDLASLSNLQIFEQNGTWTKPAWARMVWAMAVGRGGLKGSDFSATVLGGAGGSGFFHDGLWPASMIRSSMAVQVARHDTGETETIFGETLTDTVDYRLLRARSGANGGDASSGQGGAGGDGWAGGGGGRGFGGIGGTGGAGYGGREGGLFISVISNGNGSGARFDGGNGTTGGGGGAGSRVGPGANGAGGTVRAQGGRSPIVMSQIAGIPPYGQGQSTDGQPQNGCLIIYCW